MDYILPHSHTAIDRKYLNAWSNGTLKWTMIFIDPNCIRREIRQLFVNEKQCFLKCSNA